MRYIVLRAALVVASSLFSVATSGSEPASGTLTAENTDAHPLTYSASGADSFALTIDLPYDYPQKHPQTYIRLLFSGSVAGESESVDTDTPTGDPVDSTAHWANGHALTEGVNQVILVASGGTRDMTVNNSGGEGAISVSIALTHIPDDPGDPTLPWAAQGPGPRFAVHTPRYFTGVGLDYAEPTIGVNPVTGDTFSINALDVLRTRFDDSTAPARDTWESKPGIESTLVTLDPILTVDPGTGRVFALNLAGPISTADYSDDNGETWLPGGNGFPSSGVDHQGLGAGPYPSTGLGALIPHPLYPNAIYYCSQGIADAYCSRSDDGGVTFKPPAVIFLNTQCTGLHGHPQVAPDGTVYVPNKACNISSPTFGNGVHGVLVSEDAGVTWSVRAVGDELSNAQNSNDPSVAIGKDNTVYFGYHGLDGHLRVAVSQDHGRTWFNIFDVGAIAGVHVGQFPAMVAGDAGRAAIAFVGTAFPELPHFFEGDGLLATVDQPDEDIEFPGAWYGYVATTYDYGAHWHVTKVAPDDLLQGPKGLGASGENRNLLDFNDATIDNEGRVLAAFADGCVGHCSPGRTGLSPSAMRIAQIARQTGGPRMYAAFDPVEPAVPPAPRVSGWRTKDYVVLQIDADDAGSPITGYDIERNGTRIATHYPATKYVDTSASDPGAFYVYTARATNALGESADSNTFSAVVDEHAPVTSAVCTLPGQLWLDQVAEPGAETPESDIVSLGVAEPEDQPGKLVFTAQMRSFGGSAKIAFDHPRNGRYTIQMDPTATTATYTDGRWFSRTSSQLANVFAALPAPALDSSAVRPDGVMTAVVDKEAWDLKAGDVLGNIRVQGDQVGGNGQIFLRDYLGYDINQPIVGNDFCAKGAHLAPPVILLPTPTPVPDPIASNGEKRFGGALGWLTLLPLLLIALRRRMRALLAAGIALLSIAAGAAEPASGTLTEANTEANPLIYTADGSDSFALTIALPEDYGQKHPQTFIRLLFSGDVAGGESVDADTTTGDPADPTAHWAQGGSAVDEGVDQLILVPDGGTRNTVVKAAGSGPISVSIALVRIEDAAADPSLPYAAQGLGPRFAAYKPIDFPGIGLSAAEPTLGVNPQTGSVFYMNTIEPLRVKFDDATSPARHVWESAPGNISSLVTLDPILTADSTTGRIFNVQLAGPISAAEFSDDDGVTWLPGGEGFPASSVDHQTLGAGPYPSTGLGALIPHPLYPSAIYYCSQGVAIAYCSRSDDGGLTFKPSVPLYTAVTTGTSTDPTTIINNCTGIHGHVKVAPDGTVYVPNKGCQLDVPVLGAGHPGLLVSEDAGHIWAEHQVSDQVSGYISKTDPSVAIGRDNTVYFAYVPFTGHLRVSVSQDHGQTWFNDLDVGALAGIQNAVFPAVVAGDAGRAAVAFVGTRFPEMLSFYSSTLDFNFPAQSIDYPGSWHLYIASTLDYGAHWFIEQVAPDDVVQGPGGIGNGGSDRNLLDFNDAVIDTEGRVLVSYADGCLGACSRGTQGHFHRVAVIARQTGGSRMYAQFDPVEPAAPAAPRLSGYRTRAYTVLDVDTDNGGSPITGYTIERDGAVLAANYQGTRFVDMTANAPGATYRYTVTARNAQGEGAPSNDFAPLVDERAPVTSAVCTLPGQLHRDEVGEPGARPPWADLVSLGIAEPADQPGKLVFSVTNAAAIPLQGEAAFVISFDHPNARRYSITIDADSTTVSYTDGRWHASTSDQTASILTPVTDTPALDASGIDANGVVSAVLDKAAWDLAPGDMLKNVTVRTLPLAGRALVFVHDDLGYDVSQPIVGNDFCEKGAVLPPPVIDVGPVTPAPTVSTVENRFGGALDLAALLGLFGCAALRRASRGA